MQWSAKKAAGNPNEFTGSFSDNIIPVSLRRHYPDQVMGWIVSSQPYNSTPL